MLFDKRKLEPFDPHYLYHTAWASRVLFKIKPKIHYDFASDLRFVTIISSFVKIVQYNLSIPTIKLSNLEFRSTDLTKMKNIKSNSLKSVSCMHVVEHIGLGRYGDKINPSADKVAINELIRVLAPGGNLLFVTPVGIPKIFFNAHRVYAYEDILRFFSCLSLKEFSFIGDNGFYSGLELSPKINRIANHNYGCGCFWFKK
jgi:SAM-dependent methyltransferase